MIVIVVADTTPLLVLARIGRLELLRDLYAEVLVPRAVYNELVERRTTAPGVDALREASWIRVVDVGPSEAASLSPLARLDAGEAAAIRLAADLPAELLLIDEKAGRAAARSFGIPVRGTLGVIIEAKRKGLVDFVAPVLDALAREGFRVAAELHEAALRASGEAE